MPRLGLYGIQRLTLLRDVLVLSGAGVGGGSLVYANTLYEPLDGFYEDRQWASPRQSVIELAPFYDLAKRMLGVATAPDDSPNDAVLRELGRRLGVADTYRPAEVGVYLGRPGERDPDPFFGGAGPERVGCIRCGGCMVGCRPRRQKHSRPELSLPGRKAPVQPWHRYAGWSTWWPCPGAATTRRPMRPGSWPISSAATHREA